MNHTNLKTLLLEESTYGLEIIVDAQVPLGKIYTLDDRYLLCHPSDYYKIKEGIFKGSVELDEEEILNDYLTSRII